MYIRSGVGSPFKPHPKSLSINGEGLEEK